MQIKICGITSPEAARGCFEAGADMIGVVYYPPSPRHVDVERMGVILDAAEEFRRQERKVVLVVVDSLPDRLDGRFDYVQIHGKLHDDVLNTIKQPTIHVIKENRILESLLTQNNNNLTNDNQQQNQIYILEMSKGILPGGNGTTWNWEDAKQFCSTFKKTLIAGGITPENVIDAIKKAKPFGIDISSGVEAAAGIKDMKKVKQIIDIIRNISA
ncbi:MAG: phosphoribosylanthranilate isomerase [Planctomycetaceae bacterium]|jgi:phosphoribosylanthranilate isomerase|nr:phosphoribosylanthranilate isomerase [Planctomycetaceae bacterium]